MPCGVTTSTFNFLDHIFLSPSVFFGGGVKFTQVNTALRLERIHIDHSLHKLSSLRSKTVKNCTRGMSVHKRARRRDVRGGASPRMFRSANKIIKSYPACGAVSATKSTLFSPSGQSTFYFLPSLQRRLPLRVDLVKSWLRAGPRDGGERRRMRQEGAEKLIY